MSDGPDAAMDDDGGEPGDLDETEAASVAAAIRAARLDKLDALRAGGIEPYPPRFVRDRTLG